MQSMILNLVLLVVFSTQREFSSQQLHRDKASNPSMYSYYCHLGCELLLYK